MSWPSEKMWLGYKIIPQWQVNVNDMNTKEQLLERRNQLINYLKMKVDDEDWHAVADACMDLREVEAKLSMIKE